MRLTDTGNLAIEDASGLSEPTGYGCFDRDNEPIADNLCEHCGLSEDDCECYSSCCGAFMGGGNGDASFSDYGICPECKEHI